MDRIPAPVAPKGPIFLSKNAETGLLEFPAICREDIDNARAYLKIHGADKFLNDFITVQRVSSAHLLYLVKLLGFDPTKKDLVNLVMRDGAQAVNSEGLLDYEPLDKKNVVLLLKMLQSAMNNVIVSRLRLPDFSTPGDFANALLTAQKIVVLTGAGISTSLGIPDFRSSKGFYSLIDELGLDDPQDVFSLERFHYDPSTFYQIAHMILPPDGLYSPLHAFIKMLQDKGKLLRNYTQNIDNLESFAGIDPEKIIQCHGSFASATCITCKWKVHGDRIFKNIREKSLPLCPYCLSTRQRMLAKSEGIAKNSLGVLKPDITFFGEALPSRFHDNIKKDVLECDLLICVGTSLKVAPVSEIVNMVPAHVPQILINRDPVDHAEFDLSLLGLCDEVASCIVDQIPNWEIPHENYKKIIEGGFECTSEVKGTYHVKALHQVKEEKMAEMVAED